ncbi:MAG: sensor domain-containing diguanylate cyclase [Proteobacteria bacterium]|nr:sensor domain-containing diguanylate cyclase [Pseudomonadota bacterium]
MVNKADKSKNGHAKKTQEQSDSINELATFSEVGKAITSSFDLNEILNSVMETIGNHFEPKDWSLLLLDRDKDELHYELVVGEDSEKISKLRPKLDDSISGFVAKSGEPLLVPDITKDERFAKYKDSLYGFVSGPLMCVPIATNGKTLGVIELYNIQIENFENPRNMLLLTTLADYTAIAIENAMLFNRVQDLTITDDLTKLYNSRHFHNVIEYEIEKARRYDSNLSMVFIDLDYFKNVNDNHGHLSGSQLLREVGALISREIRTIDIACRYGGDEFIILMPETNKKNAIHATERLRTSLNKTIFLKGEGLDYNVTASFGVGTYPVDAKDKNELIQFTDMAMYRVKNMSRDGISSTVDVTSRKLVQEK